MYKAEREDIRLDLALKIMYKKELMQDQDMAELTLGEARTLQNTSHPNLMGVFQQIIEEDHVAFASEYLEGGSLQRYLDKVLKYVPTELQLKSCCFCGRYKVVK